MKRSHRPCRIAANRPGNHEQVVGSTGSGQTFVRKVTRRSPCPPGRRKSRPRIWRLIFWGVTLMTDPLREVLLVLDETLSLGGRGLQMTLATHLLGAIPELDSMAVVSVITSLEDRFGIVVDDDDIDGSTFATVGSLVDFVTAKLAA